MLDSRLFQQISKFTLEVSSIIRGDLEWRSVPAKDVGTNELCCLLGIQNRIRGCLDPLSEVIYSNQNELVTVGSLRVDFSDHVYAPGRERPW